MSNQLEYWPLRTTLWCLSLRMNVSARSCFHRYLKGLGYTVNHHAKLCQRLWISPEKTLWHLLTDLHQRFCRSCGLQIIVGVRKNPLVENLNDYWWKDYYHLSIKKQVKYHFFKRFRTNRQQWYWSKKILSIVYHFFLNRYYVSFLPFFREAFTLEIIPIENRRGFEIEEAHVFIIHISFHRVHEPY